MRSISGKWVGTIQGTNNGSVFAELFDSEGIISGFVHINDPVEGTGVYSVNDANVTSEAIRLVLVPNARTRLAGHGIVTILLQTGGPNSFSGDWRSSIGTAGTVSIAKVESVSQVSQGNAQVTKQENSGKKSSGEETPTGLKRTKIFVSYSHNDAEWKERIRVHLRPLERDYAIDIWDDTKIQAGSKWLDEIEKAIQSAKVALLIISADFLASDFIANNELPPLLESAKKEGAKIFPLIVSPSRFNSTKSLSQFQAVNDPAKPLINMPKGEQEDILVKLSEEIEKVIK